MIPSRLYPAKDLLPGWPSSSFNRHTRSVNYPAALYKYNISVLSRLRGCRGNGQGKPRIRNWSTVLEMIQSLSIVCEAGHLTDLRLSGELSDLYMIPK